MGHGSTREGREDHPRGSALHANLSDGGHLGAAACAEATSFSWARWFATSSKTTKTFETTWSAYTNASTILREDFRDTEDLDGFFSGWDRGEEEIRSRHAGCTRVLPAKNAEQPPVTLKQSGGHAKDRGSAKRRMPSAVRVRSDAAASTLCLSGPEAAFRPLHAGDGRALLRSSAGRFPKGSRCLHVGLRSRARPAAICYAVGWTQHSERSADHSDRRPSCNCCSGNIGRPGGGILALRGHASIQGSTDIPTLYDILPGYLPMPFFEARCPQAERLYAASTAARELDLWASFDKYFISLMKAYYGGYATQGKRLGLQLAAPREW